jgi:hypothetical protein
VKLLGLLLCSIFQIYATYSLITLVEIYKLAVEIVASIFKVHEALKTQGNNPLICKFMPNYMV